MSVLNLRKSVSERGFLSGLIELPKDRAHWSVTLLFIGLAYLLSVWVRLEWIDFAQANIIDESGKVQYLRPDMVKNGVALPNTHDSFYFGSILQKGHLGMHEDNHLIPSVFTNGMITYLPYLLLKLFPSLDIELLLLWLPVYLAGIVCIPIVLIGRLYGSSLWGFFAACLAGITHSYYNRTLAGYYDTDIFSITIPAFALYFLLGASRRNSVNYAFFAALSLYVYNFFYSSSQAVTGALGVAFILYRVILFFLDLSFHKDSNKNKVVLNDSSILTFKAILLIAFAVYAEAWSGGPVVEAADGRFSFGLLVLSILWALLRGLNPRSDCSKLHFKFFNTTPLFSVPVFILPVLSAVMIAFLALFGGVQGKIFSKLQSYVSAGEGKSSQAFTGKGYGLNYLDVVSTVREASGIPPDVVRNRILADAPSCSCPRCLPQNEKADAWIIPTAIIGFIGLGFLILRYWELCFVLPFCAIAVYCFKGAVGLRFTVHVGNVASLGIVFLIMVVLWGIVRLLLKSKNPGSLTLDFAKWATWGIAALVVCFFALPNIQHAKNYNSHVVYPMKTIEVLDKLNQASSPEDFVVTWWDYGSGCWFYGNTRTFTSPAHQTFDNFLTSEILRSSSQSRAVNLSRLKTETFVNLQKERESGGETFATAVQAIFKDGTPDLEFYQGLIQDIGDNNYTLPPKTRDVFLFLPYEILRIFPTILSFSSRNLYFPQKYGSNNTGSKDPPMMILRSGRRQGSSIVFNNGYRLDRRGFLRVEGERSGVIPYGQVLEVTENGKPALPIKAIEFDGLRIPVNNDPTATRRLLFVKNQGELAILSPETFRSTFAQRFLLDRFDQKAYQHPLFEKGPFPRNQPYMAQADWITQSGQTLSLNMRGGYRIDADVGKNLARIPGMNEPVPFSFHRSIYQSDGKMVRIPSKLVPDSRFHLVQTNLPVFLGGRTYQIPEGGQSLEEVARANGVSSDSLVASIDKDKSFQFDEFEKVEIPAKGYELRPASFFMDNDVFNSVLVQGFLMENLDPNYFQQIFASPWGKVYKILR